MDLDADRVFNLVSTSLPEAGVRCLMIGGHAVNHYGYLRATQDIDFMIAADDEPVVRRVMIHAGFTNVASHENVMFFNRPGSPLRVDFLKVARQTMDRLLAAAVAIEYFGVRRVMVPQLKDLIGMKLFALAGGNPRREDRDFPDIVHLVLENGLSVEKDLKPLCERYADMALFRRLRSRIRELSNA